MLICADCRERCGQSLGSTRRTTGELAVITFCGCVLTTVLTISGTVAYRWMERINRGESNLFDGPAWHEPLDEWSR